MIQPEKAKNFGALHVRGAPVLLYNAWDAGSAKAIADAGAQAIATSSWSVAAAQGYRDGESIPLDFVVQILERIVTAVDVPITADFEGGYTEDDSKLADNISRLLDLGIIGINFEDRVVQGAGLYSIDRQSRRISAIRQAANAMGVDLFINARTDVFFFSGRGESTKLMMSAENRGKAYADAGASGFFIPGLTDEGLIGKTCDRITIPVNVMMMDGMPSIKDLTKLGVSRISYGPIPYLTALDSLRQAAEQLHR